MKKRCSIQIMLSILLINSSSCTFDRSTSISDNLEKITNNLDNINVTFNPYLALIIYSPTCISCQTLLEIMNVKYDSSLFNISYIEYNEITNRENKSNIGISDLSLLSVYKVPLCLELENNVVINEIYGFENIRNYDFSKYKIAS